MIVTNGLCPGACLVRLGTSGRRRDDSLIRIELMVVMVALDIVVPIVLMNVATFAERRAVDTAKTEAQEVQPDVIIYLQARNSSTWYGVV